MNSVLHRLSGSDRHSRLSFSRSAVSLPVFQRTFIARIGTMGDVEASLLFQYVSQISGVKIHICADEKVSELSMMPVLH